MYLNICICLIIALIAAYFIFFKDSFDDAEYIRWTNIVSSLFREHRRKYGKDSSGRAATSSSHENELLWLDDLTFTLQNHTGLTYAVKLQVKEFARKYGYENAILPNEVYNSSH